MLLRRPISIIAEFLRLEAAAGLLIMGSAILALALANSSAAPAYGVALSYLIGVPPARLPLSLWINDGLMALFFLLVGLEIKRELLVGELSSLKRAVLPASAAVGGMVVPALIYAAINWHDSATLRGWAIPAATDIAFALSILATLGKRVPASLKVFLTALAIIDDLGAIIIIALFYTEKISVLALASAAGGLVLAFCFQSTQDPALDSVPAGRALRVVRGHGLRNSCHACGYSGRVHDPAARCRHGGRE